MRPVDDLRASKDKEEMASHQLLSLIISSMKKRS
jgi:hypothetical protein